MKKAKLWTQIQSCAKLPQMTLCTSDCFKFETLKNHNQSTMCLDSATLTKL